MKDGVVEFSRADLMESEAIWKNAVVGYCLGVKPSFKETVGFVNRSWRGIQIPIIHLLKDGIFLFDFTNEEAKRAVLIRS